MKLPRGVRRLFRLGGIRPDPEGELDDELAFHFEATVEGLVAGGMDEAEARREARRRFGDEEAYRRALRRIDERGTTRKEGRELMDTIRQHVTFALRGIRRSPGFAAAVVAILALGVGANAVMFGVLDRLLLSPPQHVVEAEDVRRVWLERTFRDGDRRRYRTLTYPDYLALREVDAFAQAAAYTYPRSMTLGRGGASEEVRVVQASATLFRLLGARPALGRFYGPDEDALGAPAVVVLSHEFWTRRYGGDPGIVGRMLDVGEGRYQVVGVAPAGFTGAELRAVDLWLPIERSEEIQTGGADWRESHGWWWLQAAVRLAPDVAEEVAAARATSAHRGGRTALIEADRYDEAAEIVLGSVIAGRGPEPAAEVRVARWLGGVSLMVLLIACFNVANLLLARAARLRREMAVRTALGIGRGRLLSQLLVQSGVLAALGSAGAWLVVRVASDPLHRILLPDVAFTDTVAHRRLLVFLAVATVLTTLLAGLLPALRASGVSVMEALRSGGRGAGGERSPARTGFLVGQAALSTVLLVGAGLFVASLDRARDVDLGMDVGRVAMMVPVWSDGIAEEERDPELARIAERLRGLPEVESAARVYALPFLQHFAIGGLRVPGLDSLPSHPSGGPYVNRVGAGYFEAMGIAVLEGRGFEASDDGAGAPPVMVMSRAMARALWPDQDAVGRCVVFETEAEPDPPCTTVVGVVEDHRRQDLVEASPHFLYFLNLSHHALEGRPSSGLVVRTAGPADETLGALAPAVRSASSAVRYPRLLSLSSQLEPYMRSWRLGATMFSLFGLLALVVAGLGLYSVLAFDVAARRHELGVRAALGADSSRLVGMVLRRALLLAGVGVAIGLVLALGVAPWAEPLLFRVSPRSPGIYVGVAAVLLLVATAAGLLPAWRTTRVDPRTVLQAE